MSKSDSASRLLLGTASTWETKFEQWSKPPSQSEQARCDNAIKAIRNAVSNSSRLRSRSITVFPQGSYRNRVNVRRDSDVDVGVMCHDVFLTHYPPGKSNADFGYSDAGYSFGQFKNELEDALVSHFGRAAVHRGNKAFDIKENSYHVEADVAPLFEFRHHLEGGAYIGGVALVPDKGFRIENFPERLLDHWPQLPLHYENGVSKNSNTSRSYKGVVRILKKLRNEMEEAGIAAAEPIPGFLIECLVWNAPDNCFSHQTWDADIQSVLTHLWSATKEDTTCNEWCEVNGIKFLFQQSQKWTRAQAHAFVDAAWTFVGVR